ncbi:MAG TPA: hypothetical protein VF584_17250 [Longimicrobium sp.]|jgi:hypothetical protein
MTGATPSRPRIRRLALLMFVGYAASVLLWLADLSSGLYRPVVTWWALCGSLGIMITGFLIFLWVLRSPRSWGRWSAAASALVLGVLILEVVPPPLVRLNNSRFLQRRDLNEFATQVHEYGRIRKMWEWPEGYTHSLNGTIVRRTRAELDSIGTERWGSNRALLADVLARDSIDPAVYEDFRRKLRRFHLEMISIEGDYVLFSRSRDGGLVHAKKGAPPLRSGMVVPGTHAVVENAHGQWYYYYR